MNQIILEIDNQLIDFNNVWYHLQDIKINDLVKEYQITVSNTHFVDIFDPENMKQDTESRESFVEKNLQELGTFILEAYIKQIITFVGKRKTYYKWVIATVDKVTEENGCLKLIGKVVPFQPHAYG